jgi:multidrug efflux pump subunit AcrB
MNTLSLAARLKRLEFRLCPGLVRPQIVISIVNSKGQALYNMRLGPVTAAFLTAIMILVFVGSWRSTLIIAISIPLAILTSVICLGFLGETINLMTLGGLALAVGILVDDATVEIENDNRILAESRHSDVRDAILEGAQQIAVPAMVSTLCICIVFLPMFSLQGVAHFLFQPLAEAVIFAMLASYLLSRTLVPTLAMYLLKLPDDHRHGPNGAWPGRRG